ncbi:MAG: hypothetical protein AB7M05_19935 [Alphaproteobacteria bacterium]
MARTSLDVQHRHIAVRLLTRSGAWLAVVLILASCSRIPTGSPDYQNGYTAGCYDGRFDADAPTTQTAWIRDESMFEANADYKSGWQEAYAKCYADERDYPIMGTIGR